MAKALLINSYRILDVAVPVRPRVSPSAESVILNLPDDDKLINAAVMVGFPKMQESLKLSFREALKNFAKDIHASYQLKIKEYENKLFEQNARVSQNDTASIKVDMPDIESAQNNTDNKSEELQKMEFNELKKLAKKLKISKDILDGIKPTMQGIKYLIDLIKSNDLFYNR